MHYDYLIEKEVTIHELNSVKQYIYHINISYVIPVHKLMMLSFMSFSFTISPMPKKVWKLVVLILIWQLVVIFAMYGSD